MKLSKLSVSGIGPFADATMMTFERDLTVITGRNDTGKSALLKVIQMVCARSEQEVLGEADVNIDHLASCSVNWQDDRRIKCEAKFEIVRDGEQKEATYLVNLAPNCWASSTLRVPGEGSYSAPQANRYLPKALLFKQGNYEGIRQQLILRDLSSIEKKLVGVMFSPNFNAESVKELSQANLEVILSRAENKLNARMARIFTGPSKLQFRLRVPSNDRSAIFINVVDDLGCTTPFGNRGTGVQRIVDLIARLALENIGEDPTLILIDEPETSLHADAQHQMRRFIEDLASKPHIQVIYVTHSPSMVNTMRPKTLRVLRRVAHGESAQSKMDLEPFTANYAMVRSSLGVSPADSLIYAPLAIIVEGKTEIVCLPILLQRLESSGNGEFADVSTMLASCIFIEVEGHGSMRSLGRIADANGCKVIGFFDGDLQKRVLKKFQQSVPKAESVCLLADTEFEDIVPRRRYFEALNEYLSEYSKFVSEDDFANWSKSAAFPKMRFSKKLDLWLTSELQMASLDKADVMMLAAQKTPMEEINIEPMAELVQKMKHALVD